MRLLVINKQFPQLQSANLYIKISTCWCYKIFSICVRSNNYIYQLPHIHIKTDYTNSNSPVHKSNGWTASRSQKGLKKVPLNRFAHVFLLLPHNISITYSLGLLWPTNPIFNVSTKARGHSTCTLWLLVGRWAIPGRYVNLRDVGIIQLLSGIARDHLYVGNSWHVSDRLLVIVFYVKLRR